MLRSLDAGQGTGYPPAMRSKVILQAMLDNGFLESEAHNPNDYITYVTKAAKQFELLLANVNAHEDVAEMVASMFDGGFCTRAAQADPNEWIMFAEAAIEELKVV